MKSRAVLLLASLLCIALISPAIAGAASASWSFEPPTFDFGVRLASEGATGPKPFELRNTGEVPLTPALVSISSQAASGFELSRNECHGTLDPGAGCTIEVTFGPRSEGRKEGTLAVESSSPVVAPATAQLLGSGGEPIVEVDPSSVVFDTIPISTWTATPSSQRTVTVTNVGSASLSIEGLDWEEAIPPGSRPVFGITGGAIGPGLCLRATVPPGGSCNFNFDFAPNAPGTYGAEGRLRDNAPGSPQTISLSGTAVVGPPPPAPVVPQDASLPVFTQKPPIRTRSRMATFAFTASVGPGGFLCRAGKSRRFSPCTSPVHLHHLKPGRQVFAVRAINATATPGPVNTYKWRIVH